MNRDCKKKRSIVWILILSLAVTGCCLLKVLLAPESHPVAEVGTATYTDVLEAFSSAIDANELVVMRTNVLSSGPFELKKGTILRVKTNGFVIPSVVAPSGYKVEQRAEGDVSVFRTFKDIPVNDVVDDLRVLWSYERNCSYDLRHTATSMDELGDGTAIGKNGHILKPDLWKARIDAGKNVEPVAYRLSDGSRGFYRFAIFPILSDSGENERFAAVIAALPSVPDADDVCFVALCGPANLTNDFSFDKPWPVFLVRAEKTVVDNIIGLAKDPQTLSSLIKRFDSGDMSSFVVRRTSGWSIPDKP